MRKSAILLAPLLFMSFAAMAAGAPPTATSVLAAARTASGGAAWGKIHSLRKVGTIRVFGLDGSAQQLIDVKTGASVSHAKLSLGTVAYGNDGMTSWSRNFGGVLSENMPAEHARALTRAYLDARGYWKPKRWPASIKLIGTESLAKRAYQVIQVTPKGGASAQLWFDAKTHLLARQVQQFMIGKDVTTFSDYRTVDGVKISFETHESAVKNDTWMHVRSVEFNVPAPKSAFEVPMQNFNDITFASSADSATMPFKLIMGRLIAIHAAIDGHPVQLILDSGGAEVVTRAFAKSNNLKATGSSKTSGGWGAQALGTQFAPVQTLTLGGKVRLHHQVFRVLPLDKLMFNKVNKLTGQNISGLVGYEMFKRFVVRIDYAHRRLTLIRPSAFNPKDAGKAIPIAFAGHWSVLKGSLDGLKGEFTLDTGSAVPLIMRSPFVMQHDLLSRYKLSSPIALGSGLSARIAHAGVFRLGPIVVKKPLVLLTSSPKGPLASGDTAGNIGGPMLKRFTVTFDYAKKHIYLKPNANFNAHHAVALPAEALKKFVGRYQIKPHVLVTISRAGDQLSIQLPGQPKLSIYPESKTAFFLKIADVQINFEVNAGNQVTGLVLHQAGHDVPAKKLKTAAVSVSSAKPKVIDLPAQSLQKFVGQYQITPNFSIAITRTGDQLKAQGTGQSALPIFPESKTEFFSKAVNVQFSFVMNAKGKVTSLVVHQSGRNIPGKKIN